MISNRKGMRHCLTAFIVLAWYLMVPPEGATQQGRAVPLSGWKRAETFKTAEKCDEFLDEQLEGRNLRFHGAACIKADDPRLAK